MIVNYSCQLRSCVKKHAHLITVIMAFIFILIFPSASLNVLSTSHYCNLLTTFYYSVKGPELINMYVGQTEENIRESELINYLLGVTYCWYVCCLYLII